MSRKLLIVRYRGWIIALTVILCLVSIIPILNIEVNSDLESYLPDSMDSKKNNNRIEEIFGKDDPLVLVFSANDVLQDTTLKRMQALSREFNRMGQFDLVMSLFDASSVEGEDGYMLVEPIVRRIPRSEASRERLRERIKNNDLVYKQLISEDFKHYLLVLNGSHLKSDEALIDSVEAVLARHPGVETLNMFGQPYLRDEANNKILHDLLLLLPLGLVVMFLFLWASFRDIRMVWLPFSIVVIAIILSMALVPLFGWELSIIGILIPIMMIAIANNYGIHVVARNQELNLLYPQSNKNRIVTNLVLFLRKPVLFTGLTTIVGIGGLVMHILKPARQMGIVSAIGIGFALLLSMSFIPAVISMQSEKKNSNKGKTELQPGHQRLLRIISGFTVSKPKLVVGLFSLVLLVCIVLLPFIKVAPDFNNILPSKHPFNKALKIVDAEFAGTHTINLMIEGDCKDPALLNKMDRLEGKLKERSEIGNVNSLSTVVRIISKALNNPGDPEYDRIPDSREAVSQYLELYAMNGDPEDIEQFVDFDYTKAIMNIQYQAKDVKTMNRLVKMIDEFSQEQNMNVLIGGYSLVEKELSMAVTIGQKNSLIFAFVLISLLLMLIFRSIPAGLLGSLPLLFAVICTFGIMIITNTELNIVTALLSSISIGLGVDYTIHILWRIKSEVARNSTMQNAIIASITTTGRGITINAFSVMAGFAVLLFSAFPLIRSFAFLIIISIGFCLLCSLMLIPAICLLGKPAFLLKQQGKKVRLNNTTMKVKIVATIIILGLFAIPGNSQTPSEVDQKAMETVSFGSMEMTATLKILDNKGRERVRQVKTSSRSFGGTDKTIIQFTAPPDIKGTSMLIYDYINKNDDMWIYLPALRKTRRIVSSEKGKSFMGSEFSNADMSKPSSGDFTHTILKEESLNGKACWKLESRCKDEDREDMYGYSRKVSWIEKGTYLCHQIEYYDFYDKLKKVQTLKNYKKQPNGKYFAFLMEMENRQNNRKSIMLVDNFRVGSDLSENYFSPAMLGK